MDISPGPLMLVVSIVLIISFFFVMLVMQYKRCPSNRVLVVYGKIAGARAARCIHGGGTFVVPLMQSYAYMSLEPMTIDIDLVTRDLPGSATWFSRQNAPADSPARTPSE